MFSKVFPSISCFWMRHWSVIPLMNPHGYPVFGDGELWERKSSGARFARRREVEADHLSSSSLTSPLNLAATWPGTQAHSCTSVSTPAAEQSPDAPTTPQLPQLLLALPLLHLFILTLGLFILIIKWHFWVQSPKIEEPQFSITKATRILFSSFQL